MNQPLPIVTALIALACWAQVAACLWLAWRNRTLPEIWISAIFVAVAAALFPVAISVTLKLFGLSFAGLSGR